MTDQQKPKKAKPTAVAEESEYRSLAIFAVVLVIILAAVGIFHFTSKSSKNATKQPSHGFTLTPPSGWKRENPPPEGTTVAFTAPTLAESDGAGTLKPFIAAQSLALNSASQKLSFTQISESYVSQLAQSYTDYQLLRTKAYTLAGTPAVLVTFSFNQDNAAVTTESLFMIKYSNSYAVNGESLTSTWPQHSADIEKSLLTFRP